MDDLEDVRLRFAREIQRLAKIKSSGLVEGLATVPREAFMGPGPWKIMRASELRQGYRITPDSDPRHLYENVLVALDERRRLNNGEPLGLLLFLDALSLSEGERLLHIGCGVGYYTAVAAHPLGPGGSVVGVELDPELAARAERNLRPYSTVRAICADGTRERFGTFDAIFVNAGCTRAAPIWLDQLAVGGRLLVPLTVGIPGMAGGAGSMLLMTRHTTGYAARFISPVGIFHCEGARSADEEALLCRAFADGNRAAVCSLRRDLHDPGPNCWLHTAEVCLQSDPALRRPPREEIQVESEILEKYTGCYDLAPDLVLTVSRRNGGLQVQVGDKAAVPIYAESEKQFFYKVVDAQITFVTDASGSTASLVFTQQGRDISGRRIGTS